MTTEFIPVAGLFLIFLWYFTVFDRASQRTLSTDRAILALRIQIGLLVLAVTAGSAALLWGVPFGQPENSPGTIAVPAIFLFLVSAFALAYFLLVILMIVYLSAVIRVFDLHARIVVFETLNSAALWIFLGALFFKLYGLQPPDWQAPAPIALSDYLYVSAVTFSTLGYGDFAPLPAARPYAAGLALIGNLHLGIFVGAVMVQFRPRRKITPSPKPPAAGSGEARP